MATSFRLETGYVKPARRFFTSIKPRISIFQGTRRVDTVFLTVRKKGMSIMPKRLICTSLHRMDVLSARCCGDAGLPQTLKTLVLPYRPKGQTYGMVVIMSKKEKKKKKKHRKVKLRMITRMEAMLQAKMQLTRSSTGFSHVEIDGTMDNGYDVQFEMKTAEKETRSGPSEREGESILAPLTGTQSPIVCQVAID